MERKLEGKVALVTGAGRGLGRAYALRLAKLGADVVINDISLQSAHDFDESICADTVMDEIHNIGQRSFGIECDAANKKAVDDMFQKILYEFGRIDILVNNAGGLQIRPETSFASNIPEEDWRREVDRNLMSCLFCCQAASIPMKKQNSGRIVNVSSIGGLTGSLTMLFEISDNPRGYYASYGVAKAGVIAYTRYLAAELAPFGINVNCIAPAVIATSRAKTRFFKEPEKLAAIESKIPLGRIGVPEDAAKVVEFLVTDLSDYIVGQCINICGGVILF